MMFTEQELEQIVREVLRRLREREITSEVRAEPAATKKTNVLELPGRLVTLETLRDKLTSIERVVVSAKAVVTPAARDELKGRKIHLEFAAAGSRVKPGRQLWLAVTTNYNAAPLVKTLAVAGLQIKPLTHTDWKEAITRMTQELKNSTTRGLLLTDRPAAAACLANRDGAIRAAVASDQRSAHDAVESLDANLLVVDPAAHSLWALQNLIKEYAQVT